MVCSGVTFTDFGSKFFTQAEYEAEAPSGHVYWLVKDPGNGFQGGADAHFGADDRVISAEIEILPTAQRPYSQGDLCQLSWDTRGWTYIQPW